MTQVTEELMNGPRSYSLANWSSAGPNRAFSVVYDSIPRKNSLPLVYVLWSCVRGAACGQMGSLGFGLQEALLAGDLLAYLSRRGERIGLEDALIGSTALAHKFTVIPLHERARTWLDAQLSGSTAMGFPWPSLLGFLRLVTNPRVFQRPEPMAKAWGQVAAWLDCEVAWIPRRRVQHRQPLGGVCVLPRNSARLPPAL